jgi:putative DNA primase/helicase
MTDSHNLDNIPAELKATRQWVNWKIEMRDDKETKVPKQPSGRSADSTDPDTWNTFDSARFTFENGARFNGVGFVFNGDYVGIDFDHCVVDGEITEPRAARMVALLNSYTEYSHSRTGVHAIVKGTMPGTGGRKKVLNAETGFAIEMYGKGRYFVMTGDVFNGSNP